VLVGQQEPVARRVVEELLPVEGAPRRARDIVTDACVRWSLADLVPSAAVVISELVSNVVDHAHTIMTIEAAVHDSCLYLAVHDGGSAPPAPRRQDATLARRGRGLHLVEAFSSEWGYVADEHGKTVWATVAMNIPGTDHVIRQ
jgi:two-component sensor histidine kinase